MEALDVYALGTGISVLVVTLTSHDPVCWI